VEAITTHQAWLTTHGELDTRRIHRARNEIEAIALAAVRTRLDDANLTHLAHRVVAGELDPYTAADTLTSSL